MLGQSVRLKSGRHSFFSPQLRAQRVAEGQFNSAGHQTSGQKAQVSQALKLIGPVTFAATFWAAHIGCHSAGRPAGWWALCSARLTRADKSSRVRRHFSGLQQAADTARCSQQVRLSFQLASSLSSIERIFARVRDSSLRARPIGDSCGQQVCALRAQIIGIIGQRL